MSTKDPPGSGMPARSRALFGRERELAKLRQLLNATTDQSALVLIEGDGGTGKTVLLDELAAALLAANRTFLPIYDFYHIDNFRASAIEGAIVSALLACQPDLQAAFVPYNEARVELDRSRITGSNFQQAQRAVREAFVASYNGAVHALASSQRVVLLFDTIEQAVALSDGADQTLQISEANPDAGGEHWLREMLPRLEKTLTVLGGRAQTLYGDPVKLYADLAARLPFDRESIAGLKPAATEALARDMLRQASAPGAPDAAIANQIELDAAKLRTWHLVSGGLPFWIALLFTLELLGQEPDSPLTRFQEQVTAADADNLALLEPEALIVRNSVFMSLAGQITVAANPLIVAIQSMVSIRKGLTPALLASVLTSLELSIDHHALFAQLARLVIVKERQPQRYTRRGERPNDPQDCERQLFLHDEMYAWLDTHPPASSDLRAAVAEKVVGWYTDAIKAAEQERLEAAERLLILPTEDRDGQVAQSALRADALRRRQQLERDLLGYTYEAGQGDYGRAAALLNLLSYEAIFAHDSGHGTALRQEALRNVARQSGRPGPAAELEFAAHWLLRTAVQNEDRPTSSVLLSRISKHYRAALDQATGLPVALLHLAIAIASLYNHFGTQSEDQAQIFATLHQAEAALAQAEAPQLSPEEQRWHRLLRAQIFNHRGYLYRLNYALAEAIRAYRHSERIIRQDLTLAPQFRATTLRNLAFALSEEGEGGEAKRVGTEALKLHLRYGTDYEVALDRSTLARVEIRLGGASRALRYAEPAVTTMRTLQSSRGLSMTLSALAEAYRKAAEQLDDSIAEQDALFAQSLNVLEELEGVLQAQDPAERLEDKHNVERWVILFQTRGCVYRSWGLARSRRSLTPVEPEHIRVNFDLAHKALEDALRVARAHVPDQGLFDAVVIKPEARQPKLILADLHEDLAAVHVNADEYDERIYIHLRQAEAMAPAYVIIPQLGVPQLPDATRSFWRELGQCELQRMIAAFGKFDYGNYTYQRENGTRLLTHAPGNEQFLVEAAYHLVRMMAYLVSYSPSSSMLVVARELTLRELLRGSGRTAEQITRIDLTAYDTAAQYNLLHSESFALVQAVLRLARENLGYDA